MVTPPPLSAALMIILEFFLKLYIAFISSWLRLGIFRCLLLITLIPYFSLLQKLSISGYGSGGFHELGILMYSILGFPKFLFSTFVLILLWVSKYNLSCMFLLSLSM